MAGGVVIGATACGNSTGPTPGITNLWGYRAPELTDGVATCNFGGTLSLTQSGSSIAGTYRNSYMSCSTPTGASSTLVSGSVSGTVNGSSVSFTLSDSSEFNSGYVDASIGANTSTGTLSKFTMSGSATYTVSINGQAHVLTGTWSAAVP
jgi:hypothetical protein